MLPFNLPFLGLLARRSDATRNRPDVQESEHFVFLHFDGRAPSGYRRLPEASITAIEINSRVIHCARRSVSPPDDGRFSVILQTLSGIFV